MNNQIFVPVSDDLIYNHPEQIEGPLIPYSAGMECSQWLAIEINPDDDRSVSKKSTSNVTEIKLIGGRMIQTQVSY